MELEPEGILPPDPASSSGTSAAVPRIEALLDSGELEEALAAIEAAEQRGEGSALDLEFLRGDALLGMGRPAAAEVSFRKVLAQDPDCPSSRCWLAMCLFLQWRFGEAREAVMAALDLPDAIPDADVVYGALLERDGRYDEADLHFARAAAALPDKYPLPVRLGRTEFDREVRRAVRRLPRQFRQCLDRVPVVVQDLPDQKLAEGPDREEVAPDIMGLFDGVPLLETSTWEGAPGRPNTIYLFQRNLERMSDGRNDLVEQIRITLWHELGHYLGFEEEDMDDLGLA